MARELIRGSGRDNLAATAARETRAGTTTASLRARVRYVALVPLGLLALAIGIWSPRPCPAAFPGRDGRIAFQTGGPGNFDVASVRPDGTGVRRLTTDGVDDGDPAYSATGRRIAFFTTRDGNSEIYTMRADGRVSGASRTTRRRTSPPASPRAAAGSPSRACATETRRST
jgi:hypothetical protein